MGLYSHSLVKSRTKGINPHILLTHLLYCCKQSEITLNVMFKPILLRRNKPNLKPAITKRIISFFFFFTVTVILKQLFDEILSSFKSLEKTPMMRFISLNFRRLQCKLLYLSSPSLTLFIAGGEKWGLLGYDVSSFFQMATLEERNSTKYLPLCQL